MKIRIVGGGFYGSHLALAFKGDGHDVTLVESSDRLFMGASGVNPARAHQGFHYPRSGVTRAACREHNAAFMRYYGHLTRHIPVNIYAVAQDESLVDFRNYLETLEREIDLIRIYDPAEHGLQNVEGAVLTGERHILIDAAREFFEHQLGDCVQYETTVQEIDSAEFDLTVDCTFCAMDDHAIDRFEPCVVGILWGPTDKAVTIMDGPFPSIYPWDEAENLCTITSAKLTPLSKTIKSYGEAQSILEALPHHEAVERAYQMLDDMAHYWPAAPGLFEVCTAKTAIRAMPKSGADSRLVDVIRVGKRALRVRAGKIDAIFRAEADVRALAGMDVAPARISESHAS